MELDYIEIGRNIRHYRLMRNIKQKELAEKFGLSVSSVKQRCLQIRKKINKKLNGN